VDSAEELEQTAKLALLLGAQPVSMLTPAQIADIETAFPS
jgi:hypothetical protein